MGETLSAALLDPSDDVATALVDLPAGTRLTLRNGMFACDVTIAEPIALGHKFAVHAIGAGQRVRKYGEAIGRAMGDIAVGAWVHVHNLESSAAMGVEARSVPVAPQPESEPAKNDVGRRRRTDDIFTFDGYRRPDGRVGVRNHVLVLSPTGLTSAAAQRVASLVRGTVCVTS